MRKHLVLGLCGTPSADEGIESFLHSTARHQLSCLILHARPCSAAIGLPALDARRCHHHKGGRQRWRPGRPLGSRAAPFSPLDSLGQIRFERSPPSACLAEREPLSLPTKNSAVGAATTAWAGSFGVFSAAGPWQETTERPQRPRPSPSPGAPPGPRPGGARRGDVSRRRSPEKGRNPAGRRRRGVADETARISPRQPLLSRGWRLHPDRPGDPAEITIVGSNHQTYLPDIDDGVASCEDFASAGATGAFDIPPVATQTGSVHVIVPAGVTVAPRRILSGRALGERRLRRLGALIPTTRCPTRSLWVIRAIHTAHSRIGRDFPGAGLRTPA